MSKQASKQAKGTVNVWLPSPGYMYTKASDLHKLDDERLVASVNFQSADRCARRASAALLPT